MLYRRRRAHFLSAWLAPNSAAGLGSKRFGGELVLETNHAEDETSSGAYLKGELGGVRELVTLKQASGSVLENRGGDAVN